MKTTPKRVNRAFNTLAKMQPAADKMTSDSHYSVERDRGTVKAEKLLKAFTKPGGKMLEPPRKYNGPFTRSV